MKSTVQLIAAAFEHSVGSAWFVRAIGVAMTRTNHTLPTERSNAAAINCTEYQALIFPSPRKARASSYAGKIGTGDEARELHAPSPPSAARYALVITKTRNGIEDTHSAAALWPCDVRLPLAMAAPVSSSAGLVPIPECTGFICSIRNSLQQVGCGIIVRLKTDKNDTTAGNINSMQEFIKLIPALSKCEAIDSTWILLTSHSVTDGSPDSLSNLNMSLHCHSSGYTIGDNVKSAISCCGPKSLIGPGNTSDEFGALLSHKLSEACDGICSIELGFTICFLNSTFVDTILERVNVRPYVIDVADCSSQAAVFEKYTIYWKDGLTNDLRQSVSTNSHYRTQIQDHQEETIKSGMESFKKNMHLQYPENEAPPGAVLINSKGAPVGIHIGKMKKDGVEITGGLNIYSLIELLRGN